MKKVFSVPEEVLSENNMGNEQSSRKNKGRSGDVKHEEFEEIAVTPMPTSEKVTSYNVIPTASLTNESVTEESKASKLDEKVACDEVSKSIESSSAVEPFPEEAGHVDDDKVKVKDTMLPECLHDNIACDYNTTSLIDFQNFGEQSEESPKQVVEEESVLSLSSVRPADIFKQSVLAAVEGDSSLSCEINNKKTSNDSEEQDQDDMRPTVFKETTATATEVESYEPVEQSGEEEEEEGEDGSDSSDDDNESVITNTSEQQCGGDLIKYFTPREVRNGKVIGEGGFGRVLKGSLMSGTPVAIKLFHAPLRENHGGELDLLATIRHKNVISVLGIVNPTEEVDCPQLVLQYFAEGNMLHYLSKPENPEDAGTLGKLSLDVVEGCRYLHQRGIVHGNLAARNVLVGKVVARHKAYFNAKITDVGVIRIAEPTGGNYMKIPGSDRVVPMRWVPKEIIEERDGQAGSEFTTASDVWSFGVLLWEIYTRGAIPYGASYSNLRVMQFLKDDYSPLKVYRPKECPKKIVAVMESIFRVRPEERPSFDAIFEHFKSYKGFGKEIKFKRHTPVAVGKAEASGEDEEKPKSFDEKNVNAVSPLKKKKPKKNKKLPPTSEKIPSASTTASTSSNPKATSTTKTHEEKETPKKMPKSPTAGGDSTDATIAELMKRVNLLEKEKRERGGHIGRGGSRGRGTDPHHWYNKRGAPSYRGTRGASHHRESPQSRDTSPIHSLAAAPPPYSEEPLPHHSVSRFSAPLPEYEYPPGRGGGRGGFPGYHEHRDRPSRSPVVLPRPSTPSGEGDVMKKIKKIAEEIEHLRAEKMTQELLKKSAELADVMKAMTTERKEDHRFPSCSRPMVRAISPQDAHPGSYYEEGYYGYEEPDREHHYRPRGQSSHRGAIRHKYSGDGQRRPYYKGRGGGRGHRGGSREGYGDGDGNYGYGT